MNRTTIATATAASIAVIAPAHAGVFDLFDDRAAWLAAVDGPIATEGFEGRENLGPINSPALFDSGLAVDWLSAADVQPAVEDIVSPHFDALLNANTTPGGSQFLRFGLLGNTPAEYTQRYLLPVTSNAFAFDITDWLPADSIGIPGGGISLYNDGGLVFSAVIPSDIADVAVTTFIGFTSNVFLFDEVRFTVFEAEAAAPDFAIPYLDVTGVDEVAWVVPAPGAAALLGLGALTACRRRR